MQRIVDPVNMPEKDLDIMSQACQPMADITLRVRAYVNIGCLAVR